jgi:hypothetical protein
MRNQNTDKNSEYIIKKLKYFQQEVDNKSDIENKTNYYNINFDKHTFAKMNQPILKPLLESSSGSDKFFLIWYKNGLLFVRKEDRASYFIKSNSTKDNIEKSSKFLTSIFECLISPSVKTVSAVFLNGILTSFDKDINPSFTDSSSFKMEIIEKRKIKYKTLSDFAIKTDVLEKNKLDFFNINELAGTYKLSKSDCLKIIQTLTDNDEVKTKQNNSNLKQEVKNTRKALKRIIQKNSQAPSNTQNSEQFNQSLNIYNISTKHNKSKLYNDKIFTNSNLKQSAMNKKIYNIYRIPTPNYKPKSAP